ncbi:MAG: sulfotransferase [Sphingomonadales bacterium]|nr:sulfotransferase [Sphingomonadales bacterium]MBU3993157.1 sulfotransferase [Alphaproteobacteria bacterium]
MAVSASATYPAMETLLAQACETAGLGDFGEGMFREGLAHLLESLERDAKLPEAGRHEAIALIRRRLANRLKIADWYKRHPETDALEVGGPVIVTGLPRTGSTALGNILSLDPQFRSLRGWEQREPVPPPELGREAQDPRRMQAAAEIDRLYREEPDHVARHIHEVDASTEDTEVLGLEFAAQQMTLPLWSYFDWWRDADMRPVFAYHRQVAKLLQSRRPPDLWLFKAPHHKFHLDALVAAYPNARFIMTHRDPAKVVPSYTSLVTSIWPAGTIERHDPHMVGEYIGRHLRIGMERAIPARARIGEDRFCDVQHPDFNRDPLGTLQRIYDFLGLELTAAMQDAVTAWLAKHRSGAHGEHRYTAEQYGLSAAGIRADYEFYIRRFGVHTGV